MAIEYKVIRTEGFDALERAINKAAKEGWELHSGSGVQAVEKMHIRNTIVATDHYYWIVVMYRREEL